MHKSIIFMNKKVQISLLKKRAISDLKRERGRWSQNEGDSLYKRKCRIFLELAVGPSLE